MPVGFSSAARNLFLLGSSGADAVTNFFKAIDKSSNPNEGQFLTSQIKYNYSDQKFLLSGTGLGNDSFGWVEKRDYNGENGASTEEWGVRINPTVYSSALTLTTIELDSNNDIIVVGKNGGVNGDYGAVAPYIAKYSNAGVLEWSSTSYTGDVEYTGVTSDSNGNYYACGNTPDTQITFAVSGEAVAFVEKFDSSGNPGWGKSALMLGRDVVLTKIASNSRGEVVAVGYLEDDSAKKGYIVKIDSSTGEVLWDRTIKSQHDPDGANPYQDVECKDIFIDSSGQIYIVGNKFNHGFIIKYTAEGNIIWQKQTDEGLFNNFTFDQVFSDSETEQVVVFGTNAAGLGTKKGLLSKYSKNGDIVWRRFLESSRDSGLQFDNVSLDADPSFYYLLFNDKGLSGQNPTTYTFGKVSSSGNGLGDFQYSSDGSTTIDYKILNAPDQIGRLSDGSVSNGSSDLITYPFTANQVVFDDLATHVSNKKRQMDSGDSFEYSGSPAIRVADFQELNLLGDVYSGSGDWLDQSGKGNDGNTSTGEPFYDAGGVRFDGSNDYLEISNSTDFQFGTGDWTIEFWWNGAPSGSFTAVITTLESSAVAGTWRIGTRYQSTNKLYFARGTGSGFTDRQIDVNVNDGLWHHIAFVRSNGVIIPFVDGVDRTSDLVNGDLLDSNSMTTSNPVKIGYNQRDNAYIEGSVSQLRVVKGTAVYTSNFTPPTGTLTAIPGTSLLTCQGNSIADASSSTHSITINGAVSDLDSERPIHNAAGWWKFDGVDDNIKVGIDPTDDYSNFTVEVWFDPASVSNYENVIDCNFNTSWVSGNVGPRLEMYATGRLTWLFSDDITNNQVNSQFDVVSGDPGDEISNDNWYHCAITFDGSGAAVYLNGEKTRTTPSNTNGGATGGEFHGFFTDVRIGNGFHLSQPPTTPERLFTGDVGEVRIYPRALTAAQVFQNYNATKSKYINEASDTAPKIGPGIVHGSNLILNYDFGNRATYDTAQNLIPNSEDFTKWNQAVHFWENNYAIAPDGTKTAALLKESIPSQQQLSYHNIGLGGASLVVGETYTFSVYAKANTRDTFEMHMYGDSNVSFNLTTGSSTSTSSMTDVGDGWWLCKWVREKTNTAGIDNVYLGFSGSTYAGAGVDESIFIWHPQFERDVTRGRYIKTSGISITAPTTVKNLSSSSNTGTLLNEPTFNSSGYFEFDGENDRIDVLPLLASTIGETFTAEVWIYPTDFSAPTGSPTDAYPRRIMSCHRSTSSTKWCLGIDTSGRLGFGGGGGVEEPVGKKYQLSLNTYYHVVLAHNGTSYKIYVNGTEEVDQTTSPIDSGSVSNLAISGRPEGQTDRVFEGRIAQSRIYNDILSSSEVSQNFNATRGKYGV